MYFILIIHTFLTAINHHHTVIPIIVPLYGNRIFYEQFCSSAFNDAY